MNDHGKQRIRQLPGEKNALGLAKFMFPNDFNIYLHDTPNGELFNKDVRAFSHGCIRVEHPDQLAQFVAVRVHVGQPARPGLGVVLDRDLVYQAHREAVLVEQRGQGLEREGMVIDDDEPVVRHARAKHPLPKLEPARPAELPHRWQAPWNLAVFPLNS